jgi:hypothetical protein
MGFARLAIGIPCKIFVLTMHAASSYVACHGISFVADKLHQQHCSNGFFLSMITVSSGPCRLLRHVSTAFQDNALNVIVGIGTSMVVTKSSQLFFARTSAS